MGVLTAHSMHRDACGMLDRELQRLKRHVTCIYMVNIQMSFVDHVHGLKSLLYADTDNS